jgi:hypothetical protein
MYYTQINKNFVHQVGNKLRLYYDARSTNHQYYHLFVQPKISVPCLLEHDRAPYSKPEESNPNYISPRWKMSRSN